MVRLYYGFHLEQILLFILRVERVERRASVRTISKANNLIRRGVMPSSNGTSVSLAIPLMLC